jgi:hypothetical protein
LAKQAPDECVEGAEGDDIGEQKTGQLLDHSGSLLRAGRVVLWWRVVVRDNDIGDDSKKDVMMVIVQPSP